MKRTTLAHKPFCDITYLQQLIFLAPPLFMRASIRELLVTPLVWCGRGIPTSGLLLQQRTLYHDHYEEIQERLRSRLLFGTGNSEFSCKLFLVAKVEDEFQECRQVISEIFEEYILSTKRFKTQ